MINLDEAYVGMRVVQTGTFSLGTVQKGSLGTIVSRVSDVGDVAVCFDDETEGHDCGGACEDGKGWWVQLVDLSPLDTPPSDIKYNFDDMF